MFTRTAIAALTLFLLAVAPAQAEVVKLTDAIPGHDKVWADLVRILVPDLTLKDDIGSAETVIPLRHIMEGEGGRPPATIELGEIQAIPSVATPTTAHCSTSNSAHPTSAWKSPPISLFSMSGCT